MARKYADLEALEQKIRDLKSLIRTLQKKLKKTSKGYRKHLVEEDIDEPTPDCPSCSRGFLKQIDIVGRKFFRCGVCDYKGKV